MQVLLVISKPVIRDLLSVNLKSFLNVDIISRATSDDAIALLDLLPEIDFVITLKENTTDDIIDLSSDNLVNYLSDSKKDIPLLILSNDEEDHKLAKNYPNTYIVPENEWELTIKETARILGISENILKVKAKHEYNPIPCSYFLNLETSCCDVFIRIKKEDNDFQFVKRIHQGDIFQSHMIQKYIDQGLKYFYIPSDQKERFTIFLSNELVKKLSQTNPEPSEETLGNVLDITMKEVLLQGFNTSTIQLTEALINNIVDSYVNKDNVSPALRRILNSKTSYLYQHAHLTSIVSSEICSNMGLRNQTFLQKMAFASLFKDITLAEHEELAMITTIEELENLNLSDEMWNKVFNHAGDASALIRKFPEAPIDIDNIIKNHHLSLNGKGFGLSENENKVSEESLIFAISVEFVNELLRFKYTRGEPRPIINDLSLKYKSPTALKIIKALEKWLKKSVQ